MKLKLLIISLSIVTIGAMWFFSPLREKGTMLTVSVISPKVEDVFDTVVTHGYVEETNKKTIRLDKTCIVEELLVSVGDFVNEESTLLNVSEKNVELSDFSEISNYIPEINDITDISSFYVPSTADIPININSEIKAPLSGIVTEIKVKEGDVALAQLPILSISDFENLCVKVSVPELYIKDIGIGQKAEITGEAFKGKKYIGLVREIDPVAKKKTSLTGATNTTIEVTLDITSVKTNLRPGYSVNARIFTGSHNNALTVPYSCIFQEDETEYVYLVNDGVLTKKAVRTGLELEDRVEVKGGINHSDTVVINPSEELSDGQYVRIDNDEI